MPVRSWHGVPSRAYCLTARRMAVYHDTGVRLPLGPPTAPWCSGSMPVSKTGGRSSNLLGAASEHGRMRGLNKRHELPSRPGGTGIRTVLRRRRGLSPSGFEPRGRHQTRGCWNRQTDAAEIRVGGCPWGFESPSLHHERLADRLGSGLQIRSGRFDSSIALHPSTMHCV